MRYEVSNLIWTLVVIASASVLGIGAAIASGYMTFLEIVNILRK